MQVCVDNQDALHLRKYMGQECPGGARVFGWAGAPFAVVTRAERACMSIRCRVQSKASHSPYTQTGPRHHQ